MLNTGNCVESATKISHISDNSRSFSQGRTQEPLNNSRPPTVIVVGAGMSGLAAAHDLVEKGFEVIVLEARDRIGGRIFTDNERFGYPIDLGASWIHGLEENPLAPLTMKHSIALHPTDVEAVFNHDGNRVDPKLADKLGQRVWEIFDTIKFDSMKEQSLKDSISSLKDYIFRNRSIFLDKMEPLEQRLLFQLFMNMEDHVGAKFENVSFDSFGTDVELEGDHSILPNGYKPFLEKIAGEQVLARIRKNEVVKRIEYRIDEGTGQSKAKVTTQNSIFEGDIVLVTIPLGVLKSGKVEFIPPLPPKKQNAIDKLGFGLFNKVYMEFPEVFWPADSDLLTLLPEKDTSWEEFMRLNIDKKPAIIEEDDEKSFVMSFLSYWKASRKPTLVAIFHSERAKQYENHSDDKIVEICVSRLRSIFPSAPSPTRTAVTRWNSDPFTLGSYSYIAVGASGNDIEELSIPENRCLYFAGEATYKPYFSTVHGAYASGVHRAQLIAKRFGMN
jgi:monoamine oxidase